MVHFGGRCTAGRDPTRPTDPLAGRLTLVRGGGRTPMTDRNDGDDLPESLLRQLEQCTGRELRSVVHYAQRLLRERRPSTSDVEPRPGEEVVRTADLGAYTIVVVERPDESGAARGPFAYRVAHEPDVDDGEGALEWHYLGRVRE